MPRKYSPMQVHKALKSADAAFNKKKFAKAIDKYKKVIFMDSKSAYAWFKLGVSYQRMDKLKEALESYNGSLKVQITFEVLYNTGLLLLQTGELKRAEDVLKKALKQPDNNDKMNFLAHFNLGRVFLSEKNSNKAIKNFKQALAINPKQPIIYFLLGEANKISKNIKQAILEYETCLSYDAAFKDAILALSRIYLEPEFDNAGLAISLITKYLKKVPIDVDLWIIKGDIHFSLNDYSNAIESYARARTIAAPSDTIILIKEANALQKFDKDFEVMDLIDSFLKINPNNLVILMYKAEFLTNQKNRDKAKKILDNIIKLPESIKNPETLIILGNLYFMNNFLDKAEEIYKLSLKFNINDKFSVQKQLIIVLIRKNLFLPAKEETLKILELGVDAIQRLQILHLQSLIDYKLENYISAELISSSALKDLKQTKDNNLLAQFTILHSKSLIKLNKTKTAKKELSNLMKINSQVKLLIKNDKDLNQVFEEEFY